SGVPSVINYLTEGGYDNYLSREEYLLSFLKYGDVDAILELEEIIGRQFQIKKELNEIFEVDEYNRI
ncbi:hypothetical protein LCGC14_0969160, partial [marine sediment metagenome]